MAKSIATQNATKANNSPLSYKHPLHRIHNDIKPILSAYRKGYTRIANLRFTKLVEALGLVHWEQIVVRELMRSTLVASGHKKPTKWDERYANA